LTHLLLLLLLLQGVYYGGLPSAVDLVRSGLARPEDFRLLLGMTGGEFLYRLYIYSFFCASAAVELVRSRLASGCCCA
jgi:hypothetical protein